MAKKAKGKMEKMEKAIETAEEEEAVKGDQGGSLMRNLLRLPLKLKSQRCPSKLICCLDLPTRSSTTKLMRSRSRLGRSTRRGRSTSKNWKSNAKT